MTDPASTSSTTFFIIFILHVILDLGHVTHYIWRGINNLSKCQVFNYYGVRETVLLNIFSKCQWVTVTCTLSPFTSLLVIVTCHRSHVNYHLSAVTCQLSFVSCHLSFVSCNLFFSFFRMSPFIFHHGTPFSHAWYPITSFTSSNSLIPF